MLDDAALQRFLADCSVDDAVVALRPDYRVALLAVDGLVPGPSDACTEEMLRVAEDVATSALADGVVEELPHVAAWRDAYRGFGAKPQRTRNSLEALLRRVPDGLPRVNRLTDLSNAVSVQHRVPLGGEDLARYVGPARLLRATGAEPFDTVAGGAAVVEHPDPGEVVWVDDAGVTCRRWNWRQGRRTRLHDGTTSALFVLDALAPCSDDALAAAVADLAERLTRLGPDVRVAQRTIPAGASDGSRA